MKQYLDLLEKIEREGDFKPNRTGIDTVSYTGMQFRHDMNEGFPLLTTKKMSLKNVAIELEFFLKGKTNVEWLQERGCNIWNPWAKKDGELGPIYGWNWRNYGALPDKVPQPEPKLPENNTYLKIGDGSNKENHPLSKTWEGMMARCYDKSSRSYSLYGEKGVHVCDRWLIFENFAEDAEKLPNYEKKLSSNKRYVLDKDSRGDGFTYGPESCMWLTDAENAIANPGKEYVVKKEGKIYKFNSPSKFAKEQGISNKNLSDLWTGSKNAKKRYGFELVKVNNLNKGFDQISFVVDGLINNSQSRRYLVSSWNPSFLKYSVLPPCHDSFQFLSNGEDLDLIWRQRSHRAPSHGNMC